ncbi:MAG: response regulator [Bacteroidia bacterium]
MGNIINCLLVDDDLDDQEIFIMIAKTVNENIRCITANDGAEALLKLNDHSQVIPDYIFLDVNMPKVNGVECLKKIKNIERLKDCKIYMYSTTSEESIVTETKKLGATDFIIKPALPFELKTILSTIFNN